MAWDLFDYKRGYDGSEWLLVIKDEYSGKLYAHTLMARNLEEVFGVLREFEAYVVRRYGLYICFMKHDGERAVFLVSGLTQYENMCREKGITIEQTPPYTKEPNGGAEKAGQEVITRSITAIAHANLPENLWPEGTVAGCKLYNMSPTARHGWKSPNEFLQQWFMNYYRHFDPEIINRITQDLKPNWDGIYVYGCRAYAMKQAREAGREKRMFKTTPRAHIGYLVGYVASNIYRIWVPELKRVIITRNVVFDETIFYNPALEKELAIGIQEKNAMVQEIEEPYHESMRDADWMLEAIFEENNDKRESQPDLGG
jgi:hypothetical protein